jgi:hypothetical protein
MINICLRGLTASLLNRSPLTGLEIFFVPQAIDSSAPSGAGCRCIDLVIA